MARKTRRWEGVVAREVRKSNSSRRTKASKAAPSVGNSIRGNQRAAKPGGSRKPRALEGSAAKARISA